MLERWQDRRVLHEAAKSIGKGICALHFESGSSKRGRTKWPLSEGGAVVGTPVCGSASEGEAILILYAFLEKGVGVLFVFHHSHVFPSGTSWGRFMEGRSEGSVVFGSLLTDACELITFVTTAASLR